MTTTISSKPATFRRPPEPRAEETTKRPHPDPVPTPNEIAGAIKEAAANAKRGAKELGTALGAVVDGSKQRKRPLPPTPIDPTPPKDVKPPKQAAVSVPGHAASIVATYDANQDGVVGIARESARFLGDRTNGSTVSVERLTRVADLQGDGDGAASQEEYEAIMREYDTGSSRMMGGAVAGDGRLSGLEWRNFLEDFGPVAGPSFADLIHKDR